MATRSFIGKINKDDSITAVYCHFDGYPNHVGRILTESYITESQVDSLLAGGDMSTLDHALAQCEFYKDRGETDTKSCTYNSFDQFLYEGKNSWVEYFYLFNHDFWSCYDNDGKRIDVKEIDYEDDMKENSR